MMSELNRRPSLLVFADDWGRHPSSCQHLVRRLRDEWRILWVNTIGTRAVKADGFTLRRGIEKLKNWCSGLKQVSDEMWVLDPPMLPMGSSNVVRAFNRRLVTTRIRSVLRKLGMQAPTVLTTLPYTAWLLGNVGERGLVYNCTDDYSYWPSADREMLQQAEKEIRSRANLVLAASRRLQDLHSAAARCEYFPHAVDFEHFASAQKHPDIPQQLKEIPGPRIGFFGLIYEKLDFQLMIDIVNGLDQAHLVLIGPCDYCPPSFAQHPRIHFLGKQPYESLPGWIAGLDVLLMPYVDDEMIRQSNPLKLRECLATGKPTISIDIPEVRRLQPHVHVAATRSAFVDAVRVALENANDERKSAERQQAVRNDSWDERARELDRHLRELGCYSSNSKA